MDQLLYRVVQVGIRQMFGTCQARIWYVLGSCQVGVRQVLGRCQVGVRLVAVLAPDFNYIIKLVIHRGPPCRQKLSSSVSRGHRNRPKRFREKASGTVSVPPSRSRLRPKNSGHHRRRNKLNQVIKMADDVFGFPPPPKIKFFWVKGIFFNHVFYSLFKLSRDNVWYTSIFQNICSLKLTTLANVATILFLQHFLVVLDGSDQHY